MVQNPTGNPQTFNRYSYTGNNPVNYTDPTGNWFWAAVIVGALLGGASAAVNDQPIWQGALLGAASGIFVGAGASAFGWAGAVGGGALGGALNSGVNGGNIGIGILAGGLGAGLGYGLGSWASGWESGSFWGQLGAAAIAGSVAGGVGAELLGGRFGQGAWMGAAFSSAGFLTAQAVNSLDPRIQKAKRYEQESKKLHDLNVKKNDMVKKDVISRDVMLGAGHEAIDGIEMGPNIRGNIRTSGTVEDIMNWNTHRHTQQALEAGTARISSVNVSSSGLVEAVALYEQYWVSTNTKYSPISYNSNYAVNTIIYSAGGSVPGGIGFNPPFGTVPPTVYHGHGFWEN